MSQTIGFSCALVTGASSGLGVEYALQIVPAVKHLVLVARREVLLEELANRIRGEHEGVEVTVIAADLTVVADRDRLLGILEERELNPDLLVNNAGMGDYGDFSSAEWGRIEAMLRLNIEALTHLTHALLPGMKSGGGGAVLNVSSLASLIPIPDFAVYAATKAYVTSFSEALRLELRDCGVRVLAVCPGPVHTGFGDVAKRGGNGRNVPGRESFYVSAEQVVAESLSALARDRARVYPGLRIAVAAVALSVVPMVLLRVAMGFRPRK